MKILLLVEDIKKISQLLRQDSSLKVIDEFEIAQDTPYTGGVIQPNYSNYIINRAATFSKIYKSSKTLCLILDQRHRNTVDKIQHDVSIRVYKGCAPHRINESFIDKVDKTIIEKDFDLNKIYEARTFTIS